MNQLLILVIAIAIILVISYMLITLLYTFTTIDYTSIDSKELKKRSEMSLYIDYETGNQYIKCGLFGQAMLRLDKDGNPLNYYKDNK